MPEGRQASAVRLSCERRKASRPAVPISLRKELETAAEALRAAGACRRRVACLFANSRLARGQV